MKKYCFKLCSIIIAMLLSSCGEEFLDRVDPSTSTSENFFSSENEFEMALYGVYNGLIRSDLYNGRLWMVTDMRSDDTEPGDDLGYRRTDGEPMDNFSLLTTDYNVRNLWSASYIAINRANTLISRAQRNDFNVDENFVKGIESEARFLRALYYFNLVRLYGDVPFIHEEVTSIEQLEIGRTNFLEIYNKGIIKDLEFAEEHLAEKWDANNLGRATKWSAKSLLAKVYLTLGELDATNYTKCRNLALDVIQNGGFQLDNNYADLFKMDNENGIESIFEINYKSGSSGYYFEGYGDPWPAQRTGIGSMFNTYFSPRFQGVKEAGGDWTREGWGFNVPTTSNDPREGGDNRNVPEGTGIVEAFTNGDLRKDVAILDYRADAELQGIPVENSISPYNVDKYTNWEQGVNGESDDNYYILRLADVYLMFAEAEAETNGGPTADAYHYINLVRSRAGLSELQAGLSFDEFLNAVYLERRLELCFEGQRWFDLIRRPQRCLETMTAHGKTIDINKLLLPIPQAAVDQSNGRISQNKGYY